MSHGTNPKGDPGVFDGEFVPPTSGTPSANGKLRFKAISDTELQVTYRGSDGIDRSITFPLE
jgi:hypothetical protein